MADMPSSPGNGVRIGELFAGRYKILSQLGQGGMGAVYHALDTELHNAPVALKLLHSRLADDPQLFERFRNEVIIARSLAHPNIVRTYDLDRAENGDYFISMEFIEGKSLSRLIASLPDRKPPFEETLRILNEILQAVGYAHKKGVIHRDLKPGNVMLTERKEVKLSDFGTARLLGAVSLTRTGETLGTPAYMAPEQICGEQCDHRTDLYAVGIIAFELAAGRLPFKGENVMAIMAQQIQNELPELPKELPDSFKRSVRRATAKRKEARFQSAEEFLEALGPAVSASQSAVTNRRYLFPVVSIAGICAAAVLAFIGVRLSEQRSNNAQEGEGRIAGLSGADDKAKQPATTTTSLPRFETTTSSSTTTTSSTTTSSSSTTTEPPNRRTEPQKGAAAGTALVSSGAQVLFRVPSSSEPQTTFTLEQISEIRLIVRVPGLPDDAARFAAAVSADQGGHTLMKIPLQLLAIESTGKLQLRGAFGAQANAKLLPGRYKVEILRGAESIGSEHFEVLAK